MLAVVVLLLAALIAFGIAALLHLVGLTYIIFVTVLLLLGIAAAVIIIVLHHRAKKRRAAEGEEAGPAALAELDLLLNDANHKLRTSQQGAKTLDALPLLYILGDSGAAKTTTVLRSGLDPELLAGTASAYTEQTPTPVLNLWFTRVAALLEIGASVRGSHALLGRLIHRTRASGYRSAFGKGAAPRAVLVCVSTDQLLVQDGGESLLASARAANAQLREISRLLGMPIPVYVIVTKTDRVPHFEQYVRNLTDAEVRQVLGSALPRSEATPGTYTDQATRRLAATLDLLAYKLGEFRVEMLDRENEPRFVPGVYEFPREFGKLRKNLNAYLVELCKPSQLSANPYLRGFYFTGIRARIVEKVSDAPAPVEANVPSDAGATQFINLAAMRTQAAGRPAPVVTSARVAQWTFLPRLLPEVILSDKSALTATRQSAPARLFRRILWGTLAFLFAVWLVCLVVSYFHNHGLEERIAADARALPATGATAISYPSTSDLNKLNDLRQVILQLDTFNANGAPWSYRWGLYQGHELDARARRIYFDRFRPMFLNPAQASFTSVMKGLGVPLDTADTNSYLAAYNPLKAYLITTSHPNAGDIAGHPDSGDVRFLTPVFLAAWNEKRPVDPAQQPLAQLQIEFYGQNLLAAQPYTDIPPDADLVERTRVYLSRFLAETRIYQTMLTDADKASTPVDFNRQFPTAVRFVSDSHVVRGAFTKAGFDFMGNALKNPGHYAQGERWVLGNKGNQLPDLNTLSTNLTAKYYSDYLSEWHLFLLNARVAPCGGLTEAPKLLDALTDPSSPMLELLFVVSHNTAVSEPKISDVFQPAQQMVDPNADKQNKYAGPGNQAYLGALTALKSAIAQVAPNPAARTDMAVFQPVATAADSASAAVKQAALNFKLDPEKDPNRHAERLVSNLLLAPIDCIARLAPSPGAATNAGGAKMCAAISPLLAKYPFSNNPAVPATLPEIDAVFTPETGSMWTNYATALKPSIVQAGANWVQAPTAPQPVSPRFLQYFNRAARVSSALYANGQKDTLTFTLHFLQGNGVGSATFVVDGQKIPGGVTTGTFNWNGATAGSASLQFDGNEALQHQGTWALFQLVRQASAVTRIPNGYRLDYRIGVTVANQLQETGKTASFELTGPGAEFLVGDAFTGLGCPGPPVK